MGYQYRADVLLIAPQVTQLDPPSAALGDLSFTLRVLGAHFAPGDQILWNGSPEPATFISENELQTGVDMTTAIVAMPIPVAVRSLGGPISNTIVFQLLPAP